MKTDSLRGDSILLMSTAGADRIPFTNLAIPAKNSHSFDCGRLRIVSEIDSQWFGAEGMPRVYV